MSRFNKYDNIFDEDDDGADIEITEEDHALSDEHGRETAIVLVRTGDSIKVDSKHDHDHRRMFYRWAKKELVDGRRRREAAAAAEKATAAAKEKAEKEQAEKEAKAKRDREKLHRSGQESEAMWARIDEETRVANAAWAAGREEREAAERAQQFEVRPRPMQMAASRPREVRPQQRAAGPAAANPARQAAPSPAQNTIPAAAAPANRMTSGSPAIPAPTGPTTARLPEPARPSSQARPAMRTSPTAELARPPAQARRSEPQPRVAPTSQPVWTPPSTGWPPHPARRRTAASPERPAAAPPPCVAPESPRPALPVTGRVLTGADLAAWRAGRGLTQRPAAHLLGVAPSTVAKAELLPAKVLGDQLQAALAAAMGP